MKELADIEAVAKLPGFEDAGLDTAQAVLEECAKLQPGRARAAERRGRPQPVVVERRRGHDDAGLQGGLSRSSAKAAGRACSIRPTSAARACRRLIGAACIEMLNSANLSFALCPLLTDGAIEALLTAGTDEQQAASTCRR